MDLKGNFLQFDGAQNIVDCGNMETIFENVKEYSVELKVRFDSFSNYSTVFSKRISDSKRCVMLQEYGNEGNEWELNCHQNQYQEVLELFPDLLTELIPEEFHP